MKRAKNKSAAYGYYGGVSNEAHYVPGNIPDYNAQWLSQIPASVRNFLVNNASNIVVRQHTDSQPGNIDTFVLSTSGKPEDVIVYQSNKDEVILDDQAGSGIESNSNDFVDGGFF